MREVARPSCGGPTRRFGKTAAGSRRWRRLECGLTFVNRADNFAKRLAELLPWLLSKVGQAGMPGGGRTLRRRTSELWRAWPLPPVTGEVRRVVFVDGIHLAGKAVVPVASSGEYVLSWYVARSESSAAHRALMARIAPPDVVVTDGGSGFQKARGEVWPGTRVQRCAPHAFEQVRRYVTTRPRTQAGVDLCALAKAPLAVSTSEQAAAWAASHAEWCSTHEGPVKARNSLTALVRSGQLFTCVDPGLVDRLGPLPAASNAVESLSAQLRAMLRERRGLSPERRVKAVRWWCCMHAGSPLPAAETLRAMPTDAGIAKEMRLASYEDGARLGPQKWGDGLVWEELHRSTPWRRDWD